MNFLAHLWLADRTATSLAGAVLGDVVRGADLTGYPDALALGIRLHRRIDARTDHHPVISALRAGFAPGDRRYAGIVLDLACDHALALDWARHHHSRLSAFCDRAGLDIEIAAPWFQAAGGRAATAVAFSQLLQSYAEPAGIEQALRRTDVRLRKPGALLQAGRDWQARVPALRERLPELLDDLRQLAPHRPA